jgi:tetratricopeptide (TPR) repeat protein
MKPRLLNCLLFVAVLATLPFSCAGPSGVVLPGIAEGTDNGTAPLVVAQAVTAADNQTGGGAITALLVADDYDRAIGEANAALGNNPQDLILREKLADAYIARAWYYKAKRLNTYTLNDLFKAVEIAPKYYRAHYELGRFHNNQWQFSIGLFDLNTALSLNPDFAPAYSERGYSNYKNRKYEAALTDVNKAIELDDTLSRSYCVRSLIYAAVGKPGLALEDADYAVRLAPGDAASYYNRSLVYTARGEAALAVTDLETTLRLSQDDLLNTRAGADLRALMK